MNKYILGIETSCDDTSVALVDKDGIVKAINTVSQDVLNDQFGGVYPEFASRAHVVNIIPAINDLIVDANIDIEKDIEAIAVTRGPGLIGSLIIGVHTAKTLGLAWSKKVIGINHLRGHLASAQLGGNKITYPAIILLVSGGHTFIAHIDEHGEIDLMGETRDDSLGEAYDKVGRMLDLKFPAGPKIDQMAKLGQPNIKLPLPLINAGLEFSFSGLKSSVARFIEKSDSINKEDLCASFVDVIVKILEKKLLLALKNKPDTKSLILVGGVAASKQIREMAENITIQQEIELCLPPIKWATDNGAMIAMAGWDYLLKGKLQDSKPVARIALEEY
jgi:N6-L-threonylcarbamoyladenine synthase